MNLYHLIKKPVFFLFIAMILFSCQTDPKKIVIHCTNNKNITIFVEFRAGETVCSGTAVGPNMTIDDEAYAGEYDVFVKESIGSVWGPYTFHSHGLFYDDNEYVVVNP